MSDETSQKSKPKKNHVVTFIEASIILIIGVAFASLEVPRFGPSRRISNQERCFRNQRTLIGAIEMYNMDQKEMIKDLDSNTYDLLIKGKYLKNTWLEETECEFFSEGDLSNDGFIYCSNHGDYSKKKKGENEEASLTPKKDSRERMKNKMVKLLIAVGPTLLYLLLRLR